MNPITLDHIRKACEWAQTAESPQPIDGLTRRYKQSNWDCGTACCVWGAANIIAGNGPATEGPPKDWATDLRQTLLVALMSSPSSTPEQMLALLHLRGANLRSANLQDADLQDATIRIGNVERRLA